MLHRCYGFRQSNVNAQRIFELILALLRIPLPLTTFFYTCETRVKIPVCINMLQFR